MRLLILVLISHFGTSLSGRLPPGLWSSRSSAFFEPDDELRPIETLLKRADGLADDGLADMEPDAITAGRLKDVLREIARRGNGAAYFSTWRPHSRFGRR
ncbi:unnamed protein product [Dibothriocephalus latus]|uniref:Uncharacterized protein n=1 Tax=Dibothriocephalus latus TaxID=60516 RepID=A0A3P7LEB1_DIBLA|nr:unnamed protein product [Dibothriocephalus latus]